MIAPCDNIPPRSITRPEMRKNTGPQPGSVCSRDEHVAARQARRLRDAREHRRAAGDASAARARASQRRARRRHGASTRCAMPASQVLAFGKRERVRRRRRGQPRMRAPANARRSLRVAREHRARPRQLDQLVPREKEDVVALESERARRDELARRSPARSAGTGCRATPV